MFSSREVIYGCFADMDFNDYIAWRIYACYSLGGYVHRIHRELASEIPKHQNQASIAVLVA